MANKFVQVEPLEPGAPPTTPVQMGMDGGFRGDVSPRQIQAGETPVLDDIRFERTAIRKDFGWQVIGAAAASRVLGIVEHKFIDGQLTFHRLVRFTRDGSDFAALEVWDGVNWVLVDTSTVTIKDTYLSLVSAQGALYVADGSQILCWGEELEDLEQENDFPLSNALTERDQFTEAIITPGDPEALDYQIHYDVTVFSSDDQDTDITVEFLHEGTVLGEKLFFVDQFESFPFTFQNEVFRFERQIDDFDLVAIKIKSATGGGGIFVQNDITTTGGSLDLETPKFPATKPAINDKYRFDITIFITVGCTALIGIYADFGSGFVFQTGVNIASFGGTGFASINLIIPGLTNSDAKFGLNIESVEGGGCSLPADVTFILTQFVVWSRTNVDFNVHGHNKEDNLDDPAGVTYNTVGPPITTFVPIDPGPGAKYLVHFARRLVALQDLGDSQVFSFSTDGILTDFTSIESGAGKLFLVSSRSDPIDALQGAAVLSSNFLAVFRARSIMRAFETGNTLLAIGVVDWIEDMGTNYPFSIRNVRGGVIFLGHDNMMYFLTERGPREIGLPIHQELIEDLTGDLTLVDSGYDPTFAEYYLGIPVGAATAINKVWVFDVDRFLRTQESIWRRKPMDVQRFATAGISEVE